MKYVLGTVLMAAVMVAGRSYAQAPPAPAPAADTAKKAIDPDAVKALERMGAYLRSLKAYQIQAATTDEDVLDDGQKIQYDSAVDIVVRVPDGLRAEIKNDRQDRQLLFNGKIFTVFARRSNMYATVPAPATIRELADKLENDYDISVPLTDLFRWGATGTATDITQAMDLGPSVVAGTTCRQYAYRQRDVDWQLWIQQGEYPLPRKLVITTKTDEARPQHSVVYTWNLAPSFNEAAFTFEPPEGAMKVVLAAAKTTDPMKGEAEKSPAKTQDDTPTQDDAKK